MAIVILILIGVVVRFEAIAIRNLHRTSLREAQIAPQSARPASRIEDLVAEAAREITALLDLQACWFEPFPFDALLPRIEPGRIVLPTPEPGVAPWSEPRIELPVRSNGMTIGRFVLQPHARTVGVVFSPTARERALAVAEQLGAPIATALVRGDLLQRTPLPLR